MGVFQNRTWSVIATALCLLVWVGCGETADPENGDNGNQNANANANDGQPEDYASLWQQLDDEYGCGGCHGATAPDITSRELVVDIGSDCDGDVLRVVPGNPEESLLWRKISPDIPEEEVCGGKMPAGGGPVSSEDAQMVYDWIAAETSE